MKCLKEVSLIAIITILFIILPVVVLKEEKSLLMIREIIEKEFER